MTIRLGDGGTPPLAGTLPGAGLDAEAELVPELVPVAIRVVNRGEGGARSRGLLGGTSPLPVDLVADGTLSPELDGIFLGVLEGVGTLDIFKGGRLCQCSI